MRRKITLETIKKELLIISPDIEVTAKEYKGCNKPLECTCRGCGNVWYPVWDNLKQGKGCMECRRKKGNDERRMTISEIKCRVKDISENLVILDDKYIDEDAEMKCGCSLCGREFLLSWRSMRNGVSCKECKKERYFNKKRHDLTRVLKHISENNIPMKYISGEYINAYSELKFQCTDCNSVFSKIWNNVKSLNQHCPVCGIESRSGVNHPQYNPNLTIKDREKHRILLYGKKYTEWCYGVHKMCDFTCALCGIREKLVAHHLYAYSTHPELRLEVSNGRTLCEGCHRDFHGRYGYGKNTPEQFKDFLKTAK